MFSLRRPLRRRIVNDDLEPKTAPPAAPPKIRSGFRFNPTVRLDPTQVTDLRGKPPPPIPPQPPKPVSEEAQRERIQMNRYRQVAKDLGTELRAGDFLPLEEVVRLQFLAKAKGQDFYRLYQRAAGRRV